MTQWTTAQRHAITARGQNVLINAGAGAGKTAALIERIFALVTDPARPISVEQMLIVTFTRAAAGEMKERLAARLRHEVLDILARGAPDAEAQERIERYEQQILLVPRAQVSTIDSFCLRIVRENADRIGLPPDIEVMDETEASLLHREKLAEVVDRLLDRDEWRPVMQALMATEKPSEEFRQLQADLLSLHRFLAALDDPHAWCQRVLASYRDLGDDSVPPNKNPIRLLIRDHVLKPLRQLAELCADFEAAIPRSSASRRTDGQAKYVEHVYNLHTLITRIIQEDTGLRDLRLLLCGSTPRRPAAGKTDEGPLMSELSAPIKKQQDEVKKRIEGLDDDIDSTNAIARDAARTLPFIEMLLGPLGVEFLDELLEDHKADRRLTFAQIARLATDLLWQDEEHVSDVAEEFRREFEHVLVDEYQDVSGMQARLLRAVCRDGSRGAPNQFAVGDVKQSIYGFRQADPTQFLSLYHDYAAYDPAVPSPVGARIDFRENFRSTPPLIDEFNGLFRVLFSAECGGIVYDESQQLVAGRTQGTEEPGKPAVSLHLIDVTEGDEEEADESPEKEDYPGQDEVAAENGEEEEDSREKDEIEARKVAELISEEVRLGRRPGDIAVLLRSARSYVGTVIEALQERGIPYFTQSATGFLQQQEIKDITAILRAILNPYDDVALIGVLRGPAFGWNEDDIARLRLASPDNDRRLFDNLKEIAGSEHALGARADRVIASVRAWQDAARREGMGGLFTRIYTDTNIREKVSTLPGGDQRLANLVQLQEYAIQFDSFRRKGIGEFLLFFDDLLDRDEDLETPSVAAEDQNSVQIMTVHKSKGLQFEVVVVPFLAKKFNDMDQKARIQVNAPESLMAIRAMPGQGPGDNISVPAHDALAGVRKGNAASEELRLLYVALTRAKSRLILTGSARAGGKPSLLRKHIPNLLTKYTAATPEALVSQPRILDWLVLGWAERIDWVSLLNGSAPFKEQGNLEVRYEEAKTGTEKAGTSEHQPAPVLDRVHREMLMRVVEQAATVAAPPIHVKVTATTAKRMYDEFEREAGKTMPAIGPEKPQWRAGREHPDWWPTGLLPPAEAAVPSGARRGTLTHQFFALADLQALRRGSSVPDELRRMVEARLLTKEDADLINVDEVEAFFADGIGQRILENHPNVRRELPIVARFNAGELLLDPPDPEHPLILQGIIDLYFEQKVNGETRGVIVDFKTDWTDGTNDRLDFLEREYSPQLVLYREGLSRALGRPIHECWLYFLTARQAILVDESLYPWRTILGMAFCRDLTPPAEGRGPAG